MGLFSADVPLKPEVQGAIPPPYWLDDVPARHRKEASKKVAAVQDDILGMLIPDEHLLCIAPSFTHTGFQGVGVLTNRRVAFFKRKLDRQIMFDNFGDTGHMVHPQGFFIMNVMSREALSFQQFKSDPSHGQGFQKFWGGTIMICFDTQWLINDFEQKIQIARGV